DLARLPGQAVRFRFHLWNGELYAFWVSPNDAGASHGYVAAGGPGLTGPTDSVGDKARVEGFVWGPGDADRNRAGWGPDDCYELVAHQIEATAPLALRAIYRGITLRNELRLTRCAAALPEPSG